MVTYSQSMLGKTDRDMFTLKPANLSHTLRLQVLHEYYLVCVGFHGNKLSDRLVGTAPTIGHAGHPEDC